MEVVYFRQFEELWVKEISGKMSSFTGRNIFMVAWSINQFFFERIIRKNIHLSTSINFVCNGQYHFGLDCSQFSIPTTLNNYFKGKIIFPQ